MPTQPFGNIYEVGTPYIDKLTDRLYNEERQAKLMRERENQVLDQEFSRNLAGIRDADIDELTKAYGEFKMAHQGLMKRKGATPQEQLEVLRKKAAIYDVITKSKQDKAWEDAQAKQIMSDKKGIYADDAQQQLIERRKLPVSKIDRAKDENLLYKYLVPDLAKELKTARGDKKTVPITLGVSKVDPLKDDKEIYEVTNNPTQFAGALLEQIVTANKGRNFAGVMNNKYDEKELEDLTNRYYAKVNDPKFIQLYGEPKPLPAMNTDLGRAVAIRTMEEYAPLDLKPSKTISEINADRSMKARQDFAKEQQARSHANSLSRLYIYANIRDREPENMQRNVDGLIANHITSGRDNNGEILVDNETFKSITGKDKDRNSVLVIDELGNYKYGKKDESGKLIVSGEIPLDAAKIKLTKTFKSGLDSKFNTGDKKLDVPKAKKMVTMVLPDGRTGEIPEDKVAQFLKDNPKAKRQ